MKKEAILILGMIVMIGMFLSLMGIIAVSASAGDSCIDSNNNSGYIVNIYPDNDGDGYGNNAGNVSDFCFNSSFPTGYADNNLDCNDNDAGIWKNLIAYLDRDADLYGDNNPVIFCSLEILSGYSNVSGDCVDTNPFMNPGSADLCNSIDDNCDGRIDEGFPDKGEVCYVGVGECRSPGTMICNQYENGTFCKGIAKKPVSEICDGKDNDCDGLIDEDGICNVTDISFAVFSPGKNIFNTNTIPINLSLVSGYGYKADLISYIDYFLNTKPKQVVLCKKCKSIGYETRKTVNLKDGIHNLSFSAVFNGTSFNINKTILVDGKKPRLYLPRIRTIDYKNGNFQINYDEDNLKNIILSYGNESVVNSNCSSGKKQTCNFFVDMSKYDGKVISYSFRIEDDAGNYEQTNTMMAEIDTTAPKIESLTYPVIGNYVYFRFNITEKNFKDISYFDNSYDKAKWKVLCTVLKGGICEKNLRLSPGEHNITVRVSDKAGNFVDVGV